MADQQQQAAAAPAAVINAQQRQHASRPPRVETCWRRSAPSICALGGQPIDIVGETEILVTGAVTVMIARSIPHELLLGSDSIERGNGVLDYKHETMILVVLEPPPRLDPEPVASTDHEAT